MYWIRPDSEVVDQIAALPSKALEPLGEVLALLEVAPEAGLLYNDEAPDGLRDVLFGPGKQGKLTYLVLMDQREVHLLRLIWVDLDEGRSDEPARIRDDLIDEEREEFVAAYREALRTAGDAFDLAELFAVLANYRRIAQLTQRQGVVAHRRMLDQVAHALRTGEAPPGSISGDGMRARLEWRLRD